MDNTNIYRPQSPDLTSFLASPSKHDTPYQPHNTTTTTNTNPNHHHNNNPLKPHPLHDPHHASYAPRSPSIPQFGHHNTNLNAYSQNQSPLGFESTRAEYVPTSQHMPPIPDLPPQHTFPPTSSPYIQPSSQQGDSRHSPTKNLYPTSFGGPYPSQQAYASRQDYAAPNSYRIHQIPLDGAGDSDPYSDNMSRAPHTTDPSSFLPPQQQPSVPATTYKDPNPNNIEIKTKFPVARIKRIMQADEEVGKVAQVTPVAVNKALELFMIALVTGAASKARDKGGKRVTAQHLKEVVLGDEQFDFLSEIVNKVADGPEAGGSKRKTVADGSDSEDEKKPKKGRGRKKKGDE